jgi:hypothetical protein
MHSFCIFVFLCSKGFDHALTNEKAGRKSFKCCSWIGNFVRVLMVPQQRALPLGHATPEMGEINLN